MKSNNITKALFIAFIMANSAVYAQKQPQVQQASVRAPENIKIDGKLDEWPSPNLNAYNSIDRIFYVISNDDKNLYFTIRGMGNGVAKKAIAGGLVITLSKSEENKKDNVSITYPLPQNSQSVSGIMAVINQIINLTDDPVNNRKEIDSIASVANKLLDNSAKEIGISGIKEIADQAISKYNEYGIKSAIQFNKLQPIIEIALPLKYIGLSTENPVSFKYNIKLKQIPEQSTNLTQPVTENPNANVGFALNDTDFSGVYTLAKKP